MTMYYCEKCQVERKLPKSTLTEHSVQCDFCDRHIEKCYQGSYANLVGLERNPDTFKTSGDSIHVTQTLSLPSNLPITKIHLGQKKHYMNDKMILVYETSMNEDESFKLKIVNRQSGEQIQIQM